MSDSVKKYYEMLEDGYKPKPAKRVMNKLDELNTIDEILEEANAYGVRQNVVDMVENMKQVLRTLNLLEEHRELQLYQEAYNACTKTPEELLDELKNGLDK